MRCAVSECVIIESHQETRLADASVANCDYLAPLDALHGGSENCFITTALSVPRTARWVCLVAKNRYRAGLSAVLPVEITIDIKGLHNNIASPHAVGGQGIGTSQITYYH